MAAASRRGSLKVWLGLTAGVLLLIGMVSLAQAAPRWLRLSWTQDPSTSITVSWTDDSAGAGQAEIREGGGNPVAVSAATLDTGSGDLNVTYTATFANLTPNTDYEYRVQSSASWTNWTMTRTAPAPGTCNAFKFVAVGDGRGENPFIYIQSPKWPVVMDIIATEDPLLVIHSGDFVHDGAETGEWLIELDDLPTLSARFPFFLAQGNHDDGPGEGPTANFNKIFAYPTDNPDATEDYFNLVMGNLQLICISTHSFSLQTQFTWLDNVLTAHQSQVDWRVVFFHVPVWSSGAGHGSNENGMAIDLIPILDSHGVDVVISGHDHNYERFHPSTGGFGAGTHVNTPLPLDNGTRGQASGVVYFVTGGAGAAMNPIPNPGDEEEGSAYYSNRIHYMSIDVQQDTLLINTRDLGDYWSLSDPTLQGDLDGIRLEKSNTICQGGPDPDGGVGPGPDGGTGPGDGGTGPGPDGGTGPGPDGSVVPGPDASPSGGASDSGCSCRTTHRRNNIPVLFLLALAIFPVISIRRKNRRL